MARKAFFLRSQDNNCDLESLKNRCRKRQFETEEYDQPADHETLKTLLPSTPAVLFAPAAEQDCWGVKLAQDALDRNLPRVIVLYASTMPSREFLCLAFKEGVDDIINLDADSETIDAKLKRAGRLLQARLDLVDAGLQGTQKVKSLQLRCRQLEQENAKWKERLLALSSTATRMATGQLRLTDTVPSVLVVATSSSQASSAANVCSALGFDTHVVHTGKDGLEQAAKSPPHVIITDGTLPDMNATEFAPAVRRALGRKPVVIVAWSSTPEAEDALLASDSGIDDFVPKSANSESEELLAAAVLGGLR
jgi:CheY-like chemotaxis protein